MCVGCCYPTAEQGKAIPTGILTDIRCLDRLIMKALLGSSVVKTQEVEFESLTNIYFFYEMKEMAQRQHNNGQFHFTNKYMLHPKSQLTVYVKPHLSKPFRHPNNIPLQCD